MDWRYKLAGVSEGKALQDVGRVTIFVSVKVITVHFWEVLDTLHEFLLLANFS